MDKVKKLVRAGASVAGAVREILGESKKSIASVAREYDVDRGGLSQTLNGLRPPTDRDLEILVAELGGTPDDWRELLAKNLSARVLAGSGTAAA